MFSRGGSLTAAFGELWQRGPLFFWDIMPKVTPQAVQFVALYAAFEAALLICVPGKRFLGPVTAGGNRPVYKARFRGRGTGRHTL